MTRLAAVAAGTAPLSDAGVSLTELFDDGEIEVGCAVDIADGAVRLDNGTTLTADAVVITAGAAPTSPPIDGIETAFPLRTADDAERLRAAIGSASALVVVGGGATGVQLAACAAAAHPNLAISLIEGGPSLLAPMADSLGRGALRILRDRDVDVVLNTEVQSIDADGVGLPDGSRRDGVVVWAGGFGARGDELGQDTLRGEGRILVDKQLRVIGSERNFAAGDVAAHLDGDGEELPMSAQIAVQSGSAAGRNAGHLLADEPLQDASLRQRGWVLDLGGGRGLAAFGPLSLDAPIVDRLPPLLHWAIDVKHLIEIAGRDAIGLLPGRQGD